MGDSDNRSTNADTTERRGSTIEVRAAVLDDVSSLIRGCARLADETESRTLQPDILEAGVRACFAHDDRGRYFVACDASAPDDVLGQLMLTREWSDWRNGWFWWIQSVYVAESARRRGVYTALHQHVLELAERDDDVCGVRLYVHQRNTPALATYLALRMRRTEYGILELDFVQRAHDPS